MSRNFFANAFGFVEEHVYAANKAKLLAGSTFTDRSLEVLMTPATNLEGAANGNGRGGAGADSDEESNMLPLPAAAKVTIPREHCLIKTGQRSVDAGLFWTPSVEELRAVVAAELQKEDVVACLKPYREAAAAASSSSSSARSAPITMGHVVGDSRALHSEPKYRGGLFQAASQFNYLEFPSPSNIPEHGITAYLYDRTQGPACAIACAAGTAFRNYLAMVDKKTFSLGRGDAATQRGQTQGLQFNGLADVEDALGGIGTFFDVRNGYVDSDRQRLAKLNGILRGGADREGDDEGSIDLNSPVVDTLIGKLRIGIHEDTEVTDLVAASNATSRFLVTQTYNSALSVGYSRVGAGLWAPMACLVLAGSYEATLLMGVLQAIKALQAHAAKKGGYTMTPAGQHPTYPHLPTPPPILLTKVGGGVFGNHSEWILVAMERALGRVSALGVPMNVLVTHFGAVDGEYTRLKRVY